MLDDSVDVAGAHFDPGLFQCAAAQYRVERRASAQQCGGAPVGGVGDNRAGIRQIVQHVRHFAAQSVDDRATEGVRVMELHDSSAAPRALCGWTGVTVDEDHVMTASGERDGGDESSRSGADDDRSHRSPLLR
jgi:hypothetical protein